MRRLHYTNYLQQGVTQQDFLQEFVPDLSEGSLSSSSSCHTEKLLLLFDVTPFTIQEAPGDSVCFAHLVDADNLQFFS